MNSGKENEPSKPRSPLISVMSDSVVSEMTNAKISVDPEEAKFPISGGGKACHMIVNYTNSKMAIKVKCTNNSSYRVDPVFQIIEPQKCKNLQISRLPTAGPSTKIEKVLVLYSECDDKVTDVKNFFKEFESKNGASNVPYIKINLAVTDNMGKSDMQTI